MKKPKCNPKRFLCFLGLHRFEYRSCPAEDGGELYWGKCSKCGKETEKQCCHTFGPFKFELPSRK